MTRNEVGREMVIENGMVERAIVVMVTGMGNGILKL